jgi:hypothetical protein
VDFLAFLKKAVAAHEGNVRRLTIKNGEGHTVMEILVAAGVVAAIAAPMVTAIGAIAALTND